MNTILLEQLALFKILSVLSPIFLLGCVNFKKKRQGRRFMCSNNDRRLCDTLVDARERTHGRARGREVDLVTSAALLRIRSTVRVGTNAVKSVDVHQRWSRLQICFDFFFCIGRALQTDDLLSCFLKF